MDRNRFFFFVDFFSALSFREAMIMFHGPCTIVEAKSLLYYGLKSMQFRSALRSQPSSSVLFVDPSWIRTIPYCGHKWASCVSVGVKRLQGRPNLLRYGHTTVFQALVAEPAALITTPVNAL